MIRDPLFHVMQLKDNYPNVEFTSSKPRHLFEAIISNNKYQSAIMLGSTYGDISTSEVIDDLHILNYLY